MPKKIKKKKNKIEPIEKKSFSLPREVKKAIWITVFFALALIFFLSLINYAGAFGVYFNKAARPLFGWGVWIVPVVLMLMGIFLVSAKDKKYQIIKLTASGFFVLVYSALLNLRLPSDAIFTYLKKGQGGGYAGLVLSYPFLRLTGFWVSLVILVALGTISLLLMFETKLFKLGKALVWLSSKLLINRLFSKFKRKIATKVQGEPEFVEDIGAINELSNQQKLSLSRKSGVKSGQEEEIAKDQAGYKTNIKDEESADDAEQFNTSLRSRFRRRIDIPLNLLYKRSDVPCSGDISANKEKIQKALKNFNIEVEMGGTSTGPTVTQYTLKPQEGVKLSQIIALNNDLALALAAHPIRIEAPIPGKSLVGIEVPNHIIATVGLREILQSKRFRLHRKSNLTIALGKDVAGEPYTANLESMPHLLIAGATGSGKSVCINSIIISLLYQNSPDDLKFILIDPKRVELSMYNNIPHLLTPVITDAKKTINALRWAVEEMDRRYDILAERGKRNIEAYNQSEDDCLPYVIIIIDELADLMSVAAKEVEALIVRLAQMARAVGIHLVLATQRPSVNVITGLIKANITSRIAFAVASQIDSRTILDCAGAEKLLGRGDMLFIAPELSKPKRVQGALVEEKETKRVSRFLKEAAGPDYLEEVVEKKSAFNMPGASDVAGFGDDQGDEFLDEARELIIRAGKASASYLQRHLRIGYARAARILDILEAEGLIGPADGAKPREVLDSPKEDDNIEERG